MTGACHCGAVSIRLAARPEYLNDCNCSLCTKSGVRWGYYATGDVEMSGETGEYVRSDVAQPTAHIHFCKTCGSTTHWSAAPHLQHHGLMGVNMRLFDPAQLAGTELRFPNGRDWDKTTPFGYLREHGVFGEV